MKQKNYTEEQYRQKFNSSVFGAILSVGVNLGIACLCGFSSLKYIYPPPEEKSMVIDFEQEEVPEIKVKKYGREPSAEIVNPEKPVEYVQKSQAQLAAKKPNVTKEATVGPDGDVEVPEPPREEPIDNRALFHSPKNSEKDTLAAHTAREVSDALKAGHSEGNVTEGKLDGTPTARLKGRNTVGTPAKPTYGVQNSGIVVVEIWVDRDGVVTKAIPGAEGTTVTDKELWNAARSAALKTHFNQNIEAPGLQQGTITYIFKLK